VVAAGVAMAALYVTFLAFSVAGIRGTARDVVFVLLSVALLLSPIAILVAIARYRLYDIDRLVAAAHPWALSRSTQPRATPCGRSSGRSWPTSAAAIPRRSSSGISQDQAWARRYSAAAAGQR